VTRQPLSRQVTELEQEQQLGCAYRGVDQHCADACAWELRISGYQLLPDRFRRRVSAVANTELSLDFL
jgi:hypothetical protein